MELWRKGKKMVVRVTVLRLAERTPVRRRSRRKARRRPRRRRLALSLGILDGNARGQFHIAASVQGVLVTGVAAGQSGGRQEHPPRRRHRAGAGTCRCARRPP
ncbi:MAG: hypothetical protein WDM81_03930 [Rhizomicrobium sp.]